VTITGCSTVIAGWHRPADIVAALAVCVAWTAVGAMVTGDTHRPVPGVGIATGAGAAAALTMLVALGVRPAYGWSGFAEAVVVLGALGLATAVAVVVMERVSPSGAQP
jgi:hypothetical protein